MEGVKKDTIGGFNTFVRGQKKLPGRASLTLVQFDSVGIDTVYEGLSVKSVPALVLEPRGGTPLLDAIGDTIGKTKHRLLKQRRKIDQVVFVIITDGEENASRKFTKKQILDLVNESAEDLKWEFVYLGANQDAIKEGSMIGIRHSFGYIASPIHTTRLWEAVDNSVSTYRGTGEFAVSAVYQAGIISTSAPGFINGSKGKYTY
jgi:hypothetical protein